jgi:hypothetical protein
MMVKVVTNLSMRGLRQHERLERLRQLAPKGVRVEPTSDDFRRLMKHPKAGGFLKEGSREWPNDRFTRRRIAEGAIKLAEEHKPPPEHQEHQAAAHRRKPDTSNNAA